MEQRYKRTDYTRPSRPAGHHPPVERAAPAITRAPLQPLRTGPIPMEAHKVKEGREQKSTFSLRFTMPSLRRPPDAGDLPRFKTKWLAIAALGIVFFIIGYMV